MRKLASDDDRREYTQGVRARKEIFQKKYYLKIFMQ